VASAAALRILSSPLNKRSMCLDWKLAIKRSTIAIYRAVEKPLQRVGININTKEAYELAYWGLRRMEEGQLGNASYKAIFTKYVDLDINFYNDKTMLDIGCGPRGSLEWGNNLSERIGLDTLVNEYRHLGINKHKMQYIDAPAEEIPYADGYFDVVSSINSLDHVDDVDAAIQEIKRVTKSGGQIILIVEIASEPTIAEPNVLDWSIKEAFLDTCNIAYERELEQDSSQRGLLPALEKNQTYNHADETKRDGFLVVRFIKR